MEITTVDIPGLLDDNGRYLEYVSSTRYSKEGRETLVQLGLWSEAEKLRYEQGKKDRDYKRSRPVNGPFIAWDGEGWEVNGRHRYTMICNSVGDSLINPNGLGTLEILRFISEVSAQTTNANHVIYGGSYDANMILSDLSYRDARWLAVSGFLTIKDRKGISYRIEYRPRRYFRVTTRKGKKKLHTLTMYDVIGFWQTSFVKTIRAWLPEEDLSFVEKYKAKRGGFTKAEVEEIHRYCQRECELLEKLMVKFRKLCLEMNICPTKWYGAGAIGETVLKRFHIKKYFPKEPLNPAIIEAEQYAYFGGRIELVQYGYSKKPVYTHDIVSAYPYAQTLLPCLAHGSWHHARDLQYLEQCTSNEGAGYSRVLLTLTNHPYTLVKLTYTSSAINLPFYPFPYREKDGRVSFPPSVSGWYWAPEVTEALRHMEPGASIVIHELWIYEPGCDEKPFEYNYDLAKKKTELKRIDPLLAQVPKLGLNSTYGKTAQKIGYRKDGPPAFHQLGWAGFVTSTTRAKMYSLAMRHPQDVIAFETDGLFSLVPHTSMYDDVNTGELGTLDVDSYDEMIYVQSGIYFAGKERKAKYRGLDPGSLTAEMVLEAWENERDTVEATSTRFQGLHTSVTSLERFQDWCQWKKDVRNVKLFPHGKRMHIHRECERCTTGNPDLLHTTWATGGSNQSAKHLLPWLDGEASSDLDRYYLADMEYAESGEEKLLPESLTSD